MYIVHIAGRYYGMLKITGRRGGYIASAWTRGYLIEKLLKNLTN